MRRITRSRILQLALAATVTLTLAACGSSSNKSQSSGGTTSGPSTPGGKPGAGKPPIVMGSKNFTEQFVLGELYKQALEAKGFTVTLKSNLGSTELIDKALAGGQLQFYPEYTGVIVSVLAHQTQRPASAQATYKEAKAFEAKRGFTLLDPTPFADTDALAVTKSYGAQHKLATVSDLKGLGSRVTLGGAPEFKTRFEGLVGMRKVYGISQIQFKPLAIGLQYKALDTNAIQVADVFTTDGQLQGGKYTVLKDPQNIFGFQNVAPIVSKKLLASEGPAFSATLNAVSAKLTDQALQQMNGAVDLNKNDPAAVAKQFLQANGLG